MSHIGGVVLAGGRSSRMGTPKAALEWHGSTLLRRTVGILARVADGQVVVVRAAGQSLPELPDRVTVVDDPREGQGPVQGIAAGLAALAGVADIAFISSTDLPFLHPAFVRRTVRALDDDEKADVALPFARGHKQPLAAAYRVGLAGPAERLVKEGRLRPAFLFSECAVAQLDDDALLSDPVLASLDPDLDSVVNVNTQDDYSAARARLAPRIGVQLSGTLAKSAARSGGLDGPGSPFAVRAATVAEAADAVGLVFGPHVTATLNGDQSTRDPQLPLAAGDTLFFRSADDIERAFSSLQ